MSAHLSVVRILLLTVTVAASPLGRLQLCGSALANKLAEICAAQGYNDPFRHSMYYGECLTELRWFLSDVRNLKCPQQISTSSL
jgi:hypothetical protein